MLRRIQQSLHRQVAAGPFYRGAEPSPLPGLVVPRTERIGGEQTLATKAGAIKDRAEEGLGREERSLVDTITTTLKREWFAKIVDGSKRVEYREIKPYWTKRLAAVKTPFRAGAAEWHDSAGSGCDRANRQDRAESERAGPEGKLRAAHWPSTQGGALGSQGSLSEVGDCGRRVARSSGDARGAASRDQ